MEKFEVGDRVEVFACTQYGHNYKGEEGRVSSIAACGDVIVRVEGHHYSIQTIHPQDLRKISTKLKKGEKKVKDKKLVGVHIKLGMRVIDTNCDNEGKVIWISEDGVHCVYEEDNKERTLRAITELKLPLLPPKVVKKKTNKKKKGKR